MRLRPRYPVRAVRWLSMLTLLAALVACGPLSASPTPTPPVLVTAVAGNALPSATVAVAATPTTFPPVDPSSPAPPTTQAVATPTAPAPPTAAPAWPPAAVDEALQRSALHPDIAAPALDGMPRYEIVASLEPPRLYGTMTLTVPNPSAEPLPDIVLRLYANAPTIYTGSRMQVAAIEGETGPLAATVEADGTALRIALPTPIAPGASATVRLSFDLRIAEGELRGYGIQQLHQGRALFGSPFPLLALRDGATWRVDPVPAVGDAASSPVALWNVRLKVPSGGNVVSTGLALPTAAGEPLHLVSGPARDMALAWLPTSPIEREVAGVRLRYWPAPLDGATLDAEGAADVAAGIVGAHAAEFGPPPYAELDVVEARVPIGGYEYPGLVILDSMQRQAGDRSSIEFLLAHEIAHQWFYALLGNDVTREPWLDESAATYAHLRYLARTRGEQAAAAQRATWESEYADDLARQPVGVNRDLYGYANWRTYRGPTYYGGALLLDDLRQRLGDAPFRAALDDLIAAHGFGEMTTADLRAAFDARAAALGITLDDLWARWLE